MKVAFLLDENLSPRLKASLKRLDRRIDVIRVGDAGAPPLKTKDPEILRYLATTQRMLVTDNRSSIPEHLADHYRAGGQSHWGIIWVRPHTPIGEIAAGLHLIWEASEAEEWLDRTDWIPF
ncbi:MAG: DUF5615 family PIN-like protein [Chitinophagales bacterium]|nr:DUF5615 family PIN-like protein [Chitinophagales bacterium]